MTLRLAYVLIAGLAAAMIPGRVSASCVACDGDAEGVRRRYSSDEWKALAAGDVLSAEVTDQAAASGKGTVEAAGLIRYPPARVWEVVVDFPSRPRYQPGTQDVRVERVDGDRVWVTQHLRFFGVDVRFTVINTLDAARGTVSWILDQGATHDIGDTQGMWQLTPVDGGRSTLLTYRSRVDTGRYVPAFIERLLIQRSLPGVIGGVRDEVKRRRQAG